MTDTPAPAPSNNTVTPGADAGAGTPLSPADIQIVTRDVRELVAKGKMTQAQADAAIKQASGNTSPSDAAANATAGPGIDAASGGAVVSATVTAAKAEIDRLVAGGDPAWQKAYLDKNDPGHKAAVDKMTKLHEAAFPEGAEAAEAAPNMGTQSTMPFEWEGTETPAHMAEANTAANEVVAALQIDPSLARGAVTMLDRAVNERRGKGPDGKMGAPKAMDKLELAKFEAMLQQRWGVAYDSKFDAVERAIAQAGKHGQWLKQTILHAGPVAAVWACETLSTQGARLAPGSAG